MRPSAMVGWLAILPLAAAGDTIHLKGGGKLTGIVVERTSTTVTVDTSAGRVGLPLTRVERIVAGSSPLDEYRQRAQALGTDAGAADWIELAAWAEAHDLRTQSREAYERVVALEPGNASAQQALGRTSVDGQWLAFGEAQRARGLVEFEGEWMMPSERERMLAAQTAAAEAKRATARAEAQASEAEARAREAEARAREAEANSANSGYGGGYWPPYGGGLDGVCGGGCGPGCRNPCIDAPTPAPTASAPAPHRPERNKSNPMTAGSKQRRQ